MDEHAAVKRITHLMRMEETAREAYDAALAKVPGSKIRPSMVRFRQTHQEHAEGLQRLTAEVGEGPVGSGAYQAYMDDVVDSVRQARDYHGLFSTMRTMEAALRLQYEEAVGSGLPDEAAQTVRAYLRDEQEMPNLLNIAGHGLGQA
ncbi:MAG: hypothetical protein IBX62_06705 [Coriobacteriia bacterium]|nr:hypothetical protein [Coriobacteriia bacterium]